MPEFYSFSYWILLLFLLVLLLFLLNVTHVEPVLIHLFSCELRLLWGHNLIHQEILVDEIVPSYKSSAPESMLPFANSHVAFC